MVLNFSIIEKKVRAMPLLSWIWDEVGTNNIGLEFELLELSFVSQIGYGCTFASYHLGSIYINNNVS